MNDPRAQQPSKVIMLGDSSVGKTSIVLQFYKAQFETANEPTIGASYVTKVLKTKMGDLPLHIWDTAGQERFKSVIPMYMRGCSAVVLVCSVDSPDSVTALNNWYRIIQDTVDVDNIYLAVNKMDLTPVEEFDMEVVRQWAVDHECKFFQTSAKQKDTIDPLFQDIAESIAQITHQATAVPENALLQNAPRKRKKCCS